MAWIELHQSLLSHRKTIALAIELEIPELYASSHMIALWLWAVDNAPNGALEDVKPAIIARAAQWPGEADRFVDAAVSSGFLIKNGDTLEIHDWWEYAGRLIEQRRANAERMRRARAAKTDRHPPEGSNSNLERSPHVQDTLPARAPATQPNPTVQNNTVQNQEPSLPARAREEAILTFPGRDDGDDETGEIDRDATVAAVAEVFGAMSKEHRSTLQNVIVKRWSRGQARALDWVEVAALCRDYHLGKGTKVASWPGRFTTWLDNTLREPERSVAPSPRNGHRKPGRAPDGRAERQEIIDLVRRNQDAWWAEHGGRPDHDLEAAR